MLPPIETSTWCNCGKQGICMGCLIEQTIQEKLGTEGLDYLTEFIPTIAFDKQTVTLIRGMGISTKTARQSMSTSMSMKP